MKIIEEFDYNVIGDMYRLEKMLWSGGLNTWQNMTDEQKEWVINLMEDCYPEGIDITQFNDYLWFQFDDDWADYIAEQ